MHSLQTKRTLQNGGRQTVEDLAPGTYFVSGIDTDAGKTAATGWIARELLALGRKAATIKPVQTGQTCERQGPEKGAALSTDICRSCSLFLSMLMDSMRFLRYTNLSLGVAL